jgi:hypothetical protein
MRIDVLVTDPAGDAEPLTITLGTIRRWELETGKGIQPFIDSGKIGWIGDLAYAAWVRIQNGGEPYEGGIDDWLDDYQVEAVSAPTPTLPVPTAPGTDS